MSMSVRNIKIIWLGWLVELVMGYVAQGK